MKIENLTTLGHAYAQHTGLALSSVSTYAADAGLFLRNLEEGGGCTVRRYTRVIAWFSDNWPDDLTWPSDIPRPPKSKPQEAA